MNTVRLPDRGFTLIEVLIAVLVLAIALGASINALGNYVRFQAQMGERYTAHGIAWNALMRCYIASVQRGTSVQQDEEDGGAVSCELSDDEEQDGVFWLWSIESDEIEGDMLFYEIKVYPESRTDEVASRLQALMAAPL